MTSAKTWRAELDLAEQAARTAGTLLNRGMFGRKEALSNEGRDIKLKADRDAEEVIIDILSRGPFSVLSEECGGVEPREHADPVWIVDPLDGTFNYSRGLDLCCTSVALWWDDKPVLGVVHRFARDEVFVGLVGHGAQLNGVPCRTSGVKDMRQAALATGFPIRADYSEGAIVQAITRIRACKKVRMFGTAALSLAFVASGRVDLYHEEGIMIWDVAAGLALVLAAGGKVEIRGEGPLSRTPLSISGSASRQLLSADSLT